MRIVHIITKCDYGGAQTVLAELASEQQRRGHDVSVIAGLTGPVSEDLTRLGISVEHEPTLTHAIHLRNDRSAFRALSSRLEKTKPDIVHTHSSKGGLLGRAAARRLDIPVVYTAHGWPFQHGAAARQRVQSFAGEWFSARGPGPVVCVSTSDFELAVSSRVCRRSDLYLVHNGVGRPGDCAVDSLKASHSDGLRLVMVARFSRPKRQDLVIEALKMLPPDISVTFVGDGELLLPNQTLARDLENRVRFAGVADPRPFLRAADAFVLVSDYEGLSISVIEAMRAGLPIIANELPGLRDAVVNGTTGLLCTSTPASLATAIESLRDPRRRALLGNAARRVWEERFTVTAMTDGYDEVYRSALVPRS